MPDKKRSLLEVVFEDFLWKSRIITLLAVIFSLVSALALFIAGSIKICYSLQHVLPQPEQVPTYDKLLSSVIGAVDLYLIGIVFLIFSFGIYELFISKIDPAKDDREINILEIKNLEDLKNRLMKVIVMALIVYFFKTVLNSQFTTPMEMIFLAGSILMVSACTFFMRKNS